MNLVKDDYKTLLRRVNKNSDEIISKDEFFDANFMLPSFAKAQDY